MKLIEIQFWEIQQNDFFACLEQHFYLFFLQHSKSCCSEPKTLPLIWKEGLFWIFSCENCHSFFVSEGKSFFWLIVFDLNNIWNSFEKILKLCETIITYSVYHYRPSHNGYPIRRTPSEWWQTDLRRHWRPKWWWYEGTKDVNGSENRSQSRSKSATSRPKRFVLIISSWDRFFFGNAMTRFGPSPDVSRWPSGTSDSKSAKSQTPKSSNWKRT